jgi:WD40 repeat protein
MSSPIRSLVAVNIVGGNAVLASAGEGVPIAFWDVSSGEPAADHPPLPAGPTGALASFDLDGRAVLAWAARGFDVALWDLEQRRSIGLMRGHRRSVLALAAFTDNDGRALLASTSGDGTLRVWDPKTRETTVDVTVGDGRSVLALTTVPDDSGTLLATAGEDGVVRLWRPHDGKRVRAFPQIHKGAVFALAWVPCAGRGLLASAGEDGQIRLWDPLRGVAHGEALEGHQGSVSALTAVSAGPEGTALASAGQDGFIRLWKVDMGASTSTGHLPGHVGTVYALTTVRRPDSGEVLASAGRDGTVRFWNPSNGVAALRQATGWIRAIASIGSEQGPMLAVAEPNGEITMRDPMRPAQVVRTMTGHTDAVYALTAFPGATGAAVLASGGRDGVVRLWALGSEKTAIHELTGHDGSVYALAAFAGSDGAVWLASGGHDRTIRLWDPVSGEAIGEPLTGHTGAVRALSAVTLSDGGTVLASGDSDGLIRLWDPAVRREWCTPLASHPGGVFALAAVSLDDGTPLLASAGRDGKVRCWTDFKDGKSSRVLYEHREWVLTLGFVWASDTRLLLLSAGADGNVALTDPAAPNGWTDAHLTDSSMVFAVAPLMSASGSPMVAYGGSSGMVTVWDLATDFRSILFPGSTDSAARRDQLDRSHLVAAICEVLRTPVRGPSDDGPDATGATVCAVEGAWGSGKTSLLQLVQLKLHEAPAPAQKATRRSPKLTAARADAILGRWTPIRNAYNWMVRRFAAPRPAAPSPRIVTAWFNPWAHQTSEQVWAGMADAILRAAGPVLHPDDSDRERYWLKRNKRHVNTRALRWMLRRGTLSPLFAFAGFALLPSIVARLLDPSIRYPVKTAFADLTLHGTQLAVLVPAAFFAAGVINWLVRYHCMSASRWLPPGVLSGPLPSGGQAGTDAAVYLRDPLYNARSGYLYLLQHDISEVVEDLHTAGATLVVFVDDLDRCGPKTAAEVLEAINLFLSEQLPTCRFVLGIDPVIVAAHLDCIYRDITTPANLMHPEDPSPGWTFLRKLIQLPIMLPRPSDTTLDKLVDHLLGRPAVAPRSKDELVSDDASPPAKGPELDEASHRQLDEPAEEDGKRPSTAADAPRTAQIISTVALERHPEVRTFLTERLRAYPERSARDVKRLLTVWSFYARVMDTALLLRGDAAVQRARDLLLLAEIVTRWPALQRRLHRRRDGRYGLTVLVGAVHHDVAWGRAVAQFGLDSRADAAAVNQLRRLIASTEVASAAGLAEELF